ncbi:hypothetical protein N0V93_006008 [Gnomoniopsis smithogilvyi]|uniref:Uncharacterized protein n=1 Tax=Gnomoniopsis smithogilvyi TaxID=1191159 RepID=A0A9W9CV71_9PEZI|nr:hypothetical protein N0V93_006008 [Gnomoniopsis smithogilvyi]
MKGFESDMAAAEEMMPASAGAESMADFASGVAGSASEMADSWAVQAAAEVVSKGSSSAEAVTEALLKAGVPTDAVKSTTEAVLNAVKAAGRGWVGRPAFNAALNVIANAVTSAGVNVATAANMVVNGAMGAGLDAALAAAGVPEAALGATAAAMGEAIEAAAATGIAPVVAAISVLSSVTSSAGVAASEAMNGASSAVLSPALSAAGVAPAAIGATADAVIDAVSSAGGSSSGALMAATNIIANAASSAFKSGSLTVFKAPSSPAEALLDVLGASYNFWHIYPSLIWEAVTLLEDTSDSEILAKVIAHGPPPTLGPYRDVAFPYRRGENRRTGLPLADVLIGNGNGQGAMETGRDPPTTPPGNDERPAPPSTGLNCAATHNEGSPESRKAESKIVVDAVKSFKHDRNKFLEYLRNHPDVLSRSQKAIEAAVCKLQQQVDHDDLSGLAQTMAKGLLQSLLTVLNELKDLRH